MEKKIILLLSVGLANKTYCDNDKFLPFHSDRFSLYTFFRSVLALPDTQITMGQTFAIFPNMFLLLAII